MEIELNQPTKDILYVEDISGNIITGLTSGDFTINLVDDSRANKSIDGWYEIYSGSYQVEFTPDSQGTWYLKLVHPTYGVYRNSYFCNDEQATADAIKVKTDNLPTDTAQELIGIDNAISGVVEEIDANETKIDIVDGLIDDVHAKLPTDYIMGSSTQSSKNDEIDAIKSKTDNLPVDTDNELNMIDNAISGLQLTTNSISGNTDTLETDLKSYMDSIEDNIRGIDNYDMTNLYDYVTTQTSAITGEINENEVKIDIIDGLVDTIHSKLPTDYIMGSSVTSPKDDEIDAILEDTSTSLPSQLSGQVNNSDAEFLRIRGLLNENTKYVVETKTPTRKAQTAYLYQYDNTGLSGTAINTWKMSGVYDDWDGLTINRFTYEG